MSTGLSTNNPAIVSAFQAALLNQGLIVLLIIALVAVAWNVQRAAQLRRARPSGQPAHHGPSPRPEPAARRLLRVTFGLIWVFDGILQGQSLDAPGHGAPGGPARRRRPRRLGPAPGERRHDDLELPPRHCRRSGGVDPGRHRAMAAWPPPTGNWSRLAGSPAWRGGSSSGSSAKPSGGSSPPGSPGCSAPPARCCSTASPAPWSPCRNRHGRALVWEGRPAGHWRCSSSGWPCSRPGRAEASGRARPGPARPPAAHRHGPADGPDAPAGPARRAGWRLSGASTPPTAGP